MIKIKQKLSYQDQMWRKIRHYKSKGEFLAALYYSEQLYGIACASWEIFNSSKSGRLWIEKNKYRIKENKC